MDGFSLPFVSVQRDLGVHIDCNLKFSDHCQKISGIASSICFRIRRCFLSKEPNFLFRIFKTYVRPILEHDSPAWSPSLKRDVLKVEKPQRTFTKFLPGMNELSYLQRLHKLNEETLLVRRIKCDLILAYKILHGYVDGLNDLLVLDNNGRTRGHGWKLKHQPFRVNGRRNFFGVRVTRFWNLLPPEIVEASNLLVFKTLIRKLTFSDINAQYFD